MSQESQQETVPVVPEAKPKVLPEAKTKAKAKEKKFMFVIADQLEREQAGDAIVNVGCFTFFIGLVVIWVAIVIKVARWAFS